MRLPATAFSLLTAGRALLQGDAGFASPQAVAVENAFIIGIGAWGLVELIKQGKKMATREDVSKLRDDVTALLANHQDDDLKQFHAIHERLNQLADRI